MKKLDSNDKFIFLASDGVWDYLNPKDIIEKCIAFLPTINVESAAKKIISDSMSKWADVEIILSRKVKEMILRFCLLLLEHAHMHNRLSLIFRLLL